MKKLKLLFILICLIFLSGCDKKDYIGYWCSYEETGTIIVLLDQNITEKEKNNLEDIINTYEDMTTYDFISKENLAQDNNSDISSIYDTYFIYFNSTETIDEALLTIQSTKGVFSATKENIKSNIAFYNLDKNKKFTYKDNIDNEDGIKISGKYKVKDNKITFKSAEKVNDLYIKDGFICGDENCDKIFTKTNELCEAD